MVRALEEDLGPIATTLWMDTKMRGGEDAMRIDVGKREEGRRALEYAHKVDECNLCLIPAVHTK